MPQSVRLFWRTARFEILAGLGISLALTLAMLAAALRLDAIRASACAGLRICDDVACTNVLSRSRSRSSSAPRSSRSSSACSTGQPSSGASSSAERALRLVARPLAGSLAAWRAWPAALLVALLLVGPALAGDRLEAASQPQFDPAQTFYDFGSRGELVVLRGLAAFAIGLAAGVVLGRTLPAILLAGALCVVGLGLAANVRPLWLPREEISLAELNQETKAVPLFLAGGAVARRALADRRRVGPLRPPDAQDITARAMRCGSSIRARTRPYVGSGVHLRDVELREAAATGASGPPGLPRRAGRGPSPPAGARLRARARRAGAWRSRPAGRHPRTALAADRAFLSWLTAVRVGRPEVLGALVASVRDRGHRARHPPPRRRPGRPGLCRHRLHPGNGPFSRSTTRSRWLYPLLASLPFVVGGLLGAPVVARELETGTGRLTWSLTGGRLRWLLWRIVHLPTVAARRPGPGRDRRQPPDRRLLDPAFYFGLGQIRGTPLVARGLAMFGIALLAGVVFRRILPALVVAAILGLLLYNALDWAMQQLAAA